MRGASNGQERKSSPDNCNGSADAYCGKGASLTETAQGAKADLLWCFDSGHPGFSDSLKFGHPLNFDSQGVEIT